MSATLFVEQALKILDDHNNHPRVALALDGLTRVLAANELCEFVARGVTSVDDIAAYIGSRDYGSGWWPSREYLSDTLGLAFERDQVSRLALRGIARSEALQHVIVDATIRSRLHREIFARAVKASGAHLPVLPEVEAAIPELSPRLFTPAAYNYAMGAVDQWVCSEFGVGERLKGLPFFRAEDLEALNESFVFPATGNNHLNWMMRMIWQRRAPSQICCTDEEKNLLYLVDLRQEKIEPGWHAVYPGPTRSMDPNMGLWWQSFFLKTADDQERAVVRKYPGWRIASVIEVLTVCHLSFRLFGKLPTADTIVRCRACEGDGSDGSSSWSVHLGEDMMSYGIQRLSTDLVGSNVGVFLSRMPVP